MVIGCFIATAPANDCFRNLEAIRRQLKNFSGLVGTNAADQIAGQGLMKARTEALPEDVEALQAALIVARVEAAAALTRQSDEVMTSPSEDGVLTNRLLGNGSSSVETDHLRREKLDGCVVAELDRVGHP